MGNHVSGEYDDDSISSEDEGYYARGQSSAASAARGGGAASNARHGVAFFSQSYGGHPEHFGFLEKRGQVNTAYRFRFFALKSQVLYYFRSASFTDLQRPLGQIILRKGVKIWITENAANEVHIRTPSRTWHLRCPSAPIAAEWLSKIGNALEGVEGGTLRSATSDAHHVVAFFEECYGSTPTLFGSVKKRGEINPRFKERFFVICGKLIVYFKSNALNQLERPLGHIVLHSGVQVLQPAEASRRDTECSIRTHSREWYLKFRDAATLEKWETVILKACYGDASNAQNDGPVSVIRSKDAADSPAAASSTSRDTAAFSVAEEMYSQGYITHDEYLSLLSDEGPEQLHDSHSAASFQKRKKHPIASYRMVRILGKGSFGIVYLVRHVTSGKVYALKAISLAKILTAQEQLREKRLRNLMAEREVMVKAEHAFVSKLKCSFMTERKVFIVMDYFAGGELMGHLARSGRFNEDACRFYAAEIASAIGYLHANKIVYRDLKPENVCICSDGHIKVTDFGLARLQNEAFGSVMTSFAGTAAYCAPEQIRGILGRRMQYTKAVDWWSFGVLVFEMLSGTQPFMDRSRNEMKVYRNIINKRRLKFPNYFSNDAKLLLHGFLKQGHGDFADRLGAHPETGTQDVKDDDFFASIDWTKLDKKGYSPPWVPPLKNATDVQFFSERLTNVPAGKLIEKGDRVSFFYFIFIFITPHPHASSAANKKSQGDHCSPPGLGYCISRYRKDGQCLMKSRARYPYTH